MGHSEEPPDLPTLTGSREHSSGAIKMEHGWEKTPQDLLGHLHLASAPCSWLWPFQRRRKKRPERHAHHHHERMTRGLSKGMSSGHHARTSLGPTPQRGWDPRTSRPADVTELERGLGGAGREVGQRQNRFNQLRNTCWVCFFARETRNNTEADGLFPPR